MDVFTQAYVALALLGAVFIAFGVFIIAALGRVIYSTGFPDEVVKWFERRTDNDSTRD